MIKSLGTENLRNILMEQKTLIIFLTLGDPSLEKTLTYTKVLLDGADILELGVPSGLGKYDGPVIRSSYKRAMRGGTTVDSALKLIEEVPTEKKMVLSYFEGALQYGLEKFMKLAAGSGAKCVLFPDLLVDYLEEFENYLNICDKFGLEPAFFVTSGFPYRLVRKLSCTQPTPAFIYLGLMASTGTPLPVSVAENIAIIKGIIGETPLLAGFSIKNSSQVAHCISSGADGVVVGSAIVKRIAESDREDKLLKELKEHVSELRKGLSAALLNPARESSCF